MSITSSRAFVPGGISSFFEIVDRRRDGSPIRDPARKGARGGGMLISRGVFTDVEVEESNRNKVIVYINSRLAEEACTSRVAAERMLKTRKKKCKVVIRHAVNLPIGAGFGTSGAGALGVSLALNRALNLNLTCNEIGENAHVAEVICSTGLGTVGPQLAGRGLLLTLRGGAPGCNLIDCIPISQKLRVIAGCFGTISKKDALASHRVKCSVNRLGRRAMALIMREPTPENFMKVCKNFAFDGPFLTTRVRNLIEDLLEYEVIGTTQNMIGEAVHALVDERNIRRILPVFRRHLQPERIVVAELDFQGARLVD